ncbi:MAG: Phenylacetic acid catabolic protein [Actinomycetota bacterium]
MSISAAVLPWSDDLFLHGQQLVRWITDYVDLEESLAVGSIAQEELAHANALMEQAGCSIEERDRRIYVREPSDWCPSALVLWPAHDWPATVARGFLLTRGLLVVVDWLGQRAGERLRRIASVIEAEQHLHAVHWCRWVDILAHTDGAWPFAHYLAAAAETCGDLFGLPVGQLAALDPEAMHRTWADSVKAELAGLGVAVPVLPDRVTERQPGGSGSELEELLRTVRALRAEHPEYVYRIYQ